MGISTEQTLLVYAGFNLVAAVVSYPVGERSDAWGRKRLLVDGPLDECLSIR